MQPTSETFVDADSVAGIGSNSSRSDLMSPLTGEQQRVMDTGSEAPYERGGPWTPTKKEIVASQVYHYLRGRLILLLRAVKPMDRVLFGVMVGSSLLVTGARIIGPFEVRNDQATQLEVANRLAQGYGLTTSNAVPRAPSDISIDPPSRYLTKWPPGLSLLLAPFLYVGLPILASLKIIYATTTLIGWVGWALIASNLIARPVPLSRTRSWIHLLTAALIPFVFTLGWGGTDIFLWAGIPFVLMCLIGINRNQPSLWSIAFAGVMFGCMVAMRYMSLFLGLGGMLVLFQVSYPQIKIFLKRFSLFLLSALSVTLPVAIYLQRHAQSLGGPPVDAEGVLFDPHGMLNRLKHILMSLTVTSNLVFGHPMLEQVLYRYKSDWPFYLAGMVSLLIVLSWPILLRRGGAASTPRLNNDLALSFSLLPVSLVLFLILVALKTEPYYLQITRYYEPLVLSGFFISYEIAARRNTFAIVKNAARVIMVVFVLYVCAFLPVLAISGRLDSLTIHVLSFTPSNSPRYLSTSQKIDYPSFTLYSKKENTKTKVKQLYRENPQALFYAQNYVLFIYDGFEGGPIPGKTFRAFPQAPFWGSAYTTKPVKIFWVLGQETRLDFIPESNRTLVFADPVERTKILVSDFPAGKLFSGEKVLQRDNVGPGSVTDESISMRAESLDP
jgi:hypothetical protein